MKWPSRHELLFSGKSYAAAMLALFIAYGIGLPRPFWALVTAYVVSNPLAGAVRSKALYRLSGTLVGGIATVVLVPLLANAPELLVLALALWVGICLFVALRDRTPRTYLFMLAGYTAALIGFPVVSDPLSAFDTAVARVQEIGLGIVCGTLVHSLVFPRSLGPVLLERLQHALADARHWMRDALHGDSPQHEARDRRKLAADITELRLLATHLPFDTSHLRWTSNAISALQDRLAALVPLLSALEDRIRALRAAGVDAASPWRALLDAVSAWSATPFAGADAEAREAARLHARIEQLTPSLNARGNWVAMLETNLALRLHSIIDAWQQCRLLRHQLDAGLTGGVRPAMNSRPGLSPAVLHRDSGMALLSSFAAVIAIVSCSAFWIITGWPAGAAAPMMAAVFCCFFASQDDPVPAIMRFFTYTVLSIPVSALYLLLILPAVHSFESLLLVTAPLFLLVGIFIARPATSSQAMAFLFGVTGAFSLMDTRSADLVSFANGMLAQLAGIGAAAFFTRLLRSVDAGWTARRLLRRGWAELAALGLNRRLPSMAQASALMLDRIGLLTPRLAMAEPDGDLAAVDALSDMRVGLNMTLLASLPQPSLALRELMDGLRAYFGQRHGQSAAPAGTLLARIDRALDEAWGDQQRELVAALVAIRRDLFPAVHAFPAPGAAAATEARP